MLYLNCITYRLQTNKNYWVKFMLHNRGFSIVIITWILLFSGIFLLNACEPNITGSDNGPSGELPRELAPTEMMLIEADRSFSYELFRKTVEYDSDSENLMISPLSISMALSMTLNGAQGQTFEDMRNTLYLADMNMDEINEAFQSLIELLSTVDPEVTFLIANSIWYRDGLPVEEDFLERVKAYYGAEVSGLDFSDPASVDIINDWVRQNTDGLIEEIVEEIPEDIVMYLINALYYQGDWLRQFDVEDTQKADFNLESGETVEVEMMRQDGLFATYMSNEVQMIELPYGDSLFSMTVMMPADPNMPIDQFIEEKISAESLNTWRSNLSVDNREATVNLPKFELEYEIEYKDILKAMGMEIAFDEFEADFLGIADVRPQNLYIDHVTHKTFIRVDEEGTEAAAVTSVGMIPTSMPPQMIVDRPFVYIIYERVSGTNLFMGKVKNPVL